MSKPKLLLVHGVGQHTADSFKKKFNEVFKKAFELYPQYENKSAEDYVELVPLEYSSIFDEHRERMANRSVPIMNRLSSLLFPSDFLSEAVKEIEEIEKDINDDDFFKAHILDVIFYRFTTLGENVRFKIAHDIINAITTAVEGPSRVHILAHSLGTSVVHDTLAKLYDENADNNNLSVASHKLGSLHMISNTSRILESFVKTNKSVVKPGEDGCVSFYIEYRHVLDPITWSRQFNPTDNSQWISNDDWYFQRYKLIRPTSITEKNGNTHSLENYIFNPLVHQEIFKTVFGIKLTEEEKDNAHDKYIKNTLNKSAVKLEDALEKLDEGNINSITKNDLTTLPLTGSAILTKNARSNWGFLSQAAQRVCANWVGPTI